MLELQIMQQRLHDIPVSRISDRLVRQVLNLSSEGIREGAEAPGGIETLIGDAIQRKVLELFQWRYLGHFTIAQRDTGFAVFIDDPVGTPGEVVVKGIRRELR